MKALATFSILMGLIFIQMFINYDYTADVYTKAESEALSFIIYRNSVNELSINTKREKIFSFNELDLPGSYNRKNWKNQTITNKYNTLDCYVYAENMTVDFLNAVEIMLKKSASIGWNDGGILVRKKGPNIQLPSFIPHGSLVSVITID